MNWLTTDLLFVPLLICLVFCGLYYAVLRLTLARRSIVLNAVANGILPMVTIIVPTHNEEGIIGEMLQNTLKLEYPAEKMEILVVDSASSDRTRDIVGRYVDQYPTSIRLISQKSRSVVYSERSAGGS